MKGVLTLAGLYKEKAGLGVATQILQVGKQKMNVKVVSNTIFIPAKVNDDAQQPGVLPKPS